MDNLDWILRNGWLMTVECMRDKISVAENIVRTNTATVDKDGAANHGIVVVLEGSVPELGLVDVEEGPVTPSLLTMGVVGEVVWGNAAQTITFEMVWSGPRVSDGSDEGQVGV
jgi:hypothetical protein